VTNGSPLEVPCSYRCHHNLCPTTEGAAGAGAPGRTINDATVALRDGFISDRVGNLPLETQQASHKRKRTPQSDTIKSDEERSLDGSGDSDSGSSFFADDDAGISEEARDGLDGFLAANGVGDVCARQAAWGQRRRAEPYVDPEDSDY
jgi:hypothetical protein